MGAERRPGRADVRRRPVAGAGPAVVLVVLLAIAGLAAWGTHRVVRDQERRLLRERTNEVGLVLSTAIDDIPTTLESLGTTLRADGGSVPAFRIAASGDLGPASSDEAYALCRPDGRDYRVYAAVGTGLRAGQILSGSRAQAALDAARAGRTIATPVLGTGRFRTLGFALGTPAGPAGSVIYRQTELGPLSAPREARTAPFQEVRVVLYASPHVDRSQVIVATSPDMRLTGDVDHLPVPAGSSRWLLAVNAVRPLVGSVASDAPIFVLVTGVVGAGLIAFLVAVETRRREAAVALYASEHQLAETLQRSLLPVLVPLAGLEAATRYLPGEVSQQVGGDWFDAFSLDDGQVGVVIGDVVGHDLVAATAMSQLRATLRACGWQGGSPAVVLSRLDQLVEKFEITDLVTVFYGVLDPPDADGTRMLVYANAGHPPPLVQGPDGRVHRLEGGASVVIGAPEGTARPEGKERLSAGSTLLLFTDGLVEVRGEPIDESIRQLITIVDGHTPADGVEVLCERVVTGLHHDGRQDDIAVLALQLKIDRVT